MLGTIVNVIAIVIGSSLGLILKKGITEKSKETVLQGVGLAVILIGLKMGFQVNNELIVIISLVLGGLIGEILRIDEKLDLFGEKLQQKVGAGEGDFVKGFVTASLVFCVGAMAIMGAIEGGLTGTYKILFAKSALDFFTSLILSSSLGIGVMFSAVPVLIYQGIITLVSAGAKDILIDPVITYMTATGGLLIVGIGINILGFKNINVANLLPAIFIAILATLLALQWFPNYV